MTDTTNSAEAKRALLEKILRNRLGQGAAAASAIPRRAQDGPAPLSFAQQQFWLLSQLAPESARYHDYLSIRLSGPLNVAALEESLNELLRRHEAWRTSFPVVDGQPVQRIHPPADVRLPLIDLRHAPAAEREAQARRPRQEFAQIFDLTQAPPLRIYLLRLDDEEHRLCFILHHILFDAFTFSQVLLPELDALYQAFSAGQPSPLPEPPVQYADYAAWQRQSLTGKKLADHLAYWKQHLAGAPAALELPTDYARQPIPSHRGATYPFALPARLCNALQALSREEGATLFTTLLAAFATLLSRYTSQDDIVIGTPATGRRYQELQGLLGVFINTLALRLDLSGAPSFRALLQRARQTMLASLDHQDAPFELVVQELQPERAPGQNPLFQALLTLEQAAPTPSSGWAIDQAKDLADTSAVDLGLTLEETAQGGLSGSLSYSTELFEAATIERMIGHWQTLLEGIIADPDQPITTLPLLTAAERQQMLVDWNATQADYPHHLCFHQLFEQQAERTPDAPAVVYADGQLTYRQLNERANHLAHYLRRLGVGPETLVGLCLERSLDLLVGLFGILKAGGAYIPLDPAYPPERLAFMLEDAGAPVLLTQASLLKSLPPHQAQVVCLDTEGATIAQERSDNPESGVTPENLAYVIYTSGSTGKPKGVMIMHRGIPNFAQGTHRIYHTGPGWRILELASFSFDASVADMLVALPIGGTLYIATEDERVPGPALIRLLQKQAINVAVFMPSMLATLPAHDLPDLQIIVSAGEACSADLVAKWAKGRRFLNVYGPTEATIGTTLAECVDNGQAPSIGRPLPNRQVYVLDKHLQPVPIGVPGELCIGGISLARGYLHRPELTAERFIPNPFSAEPDARLYKTGDLVRWRPDGNLEYVGRFDQQIKIRGFRIELGEIETVLGQHPQVREAIVLAREDMPGEKRLVAYVVSMTGEALASATLRSFLQQRLPFYMIPAAFVFLEALPLNQSDKVDRRALPAPEEVGTLSGEAFVAPRTPSEERLAAIWATLLGVKQVGIYDNFFALGGHSLLAVRVLAQVQEQVQVELPLSSLFEAPTIADLALKITQKQADQVDDELTAQLLAELEQLPDDEAQRMLAGDKQVEREKGAK